MFNFRKHIQRDTFKYIPHYAPKATRPCVLTYACVRIRWLVRFAPGFYRLPATAHQWSGLVARKVLVRCISTIQSGHYMPALYGGCAQGALGRTGLANSTGLLTCVQPPPFF
ncbi:hypothetical protein D3C78_1077890 [compost metagenome]